jgi:LysM domain
VFGTGDVVSVAFEFEYEACRPRLRALPDLPAHGGRVRLTRRRQVGLAAAVVVVVLLLVLLALPLRALGGSTLAQVAPAPGADYVVKPGDTLVSIANRADRSHARTLAAQLAREAGSSVVVPGEHLHIP